MATADLRYTALIARRDTLDIEANDILQRIINAVKAELDGENSPLYRALGYKTKNERGVTGPKNTTTPSVSAAAANGAEPLVTFSGELIYSFGNSQTATSGVSAQK